MSDSGRQDTGLLRCRQDHNWAVENRPAYGYYCYECEGYIRFHEYYLADSGGSS